MEGVRFEESPFGYWYNCLESEWHEKVTALQAELEETSQAPDVYVYFRASEGVHPDRLAFYTPCNASYIPPGWRYPLGTIY